MKIKKYLMQIIGFSMGVIVGLTTLYIVMGTDTCALCGNPIRHTTSKVDPNGWIAENVGGGNPSQDYPVLTTNLLAQIEQRLDALSNRLERLERRIHPSP